MLGIMTAAVIFVSVSVLIKKFVQFMIPSYLKKLAPKTRICFWLTNKYDWSLCEQIYNFEEC